MVFKTEFRDLFFKSSTADINSTEVDGLKCIEVTFYDKEEVKHAFWMDEKTAIKFAKKLRTEINKIQD